VDTVNGASQIQSVQPSKTDADSTSSQAELATEPPVAPTTGDQSDMSLQVRSAVTEPQITLLESTPLNPTIESASELAAPAPPAEDLCLDVKITAACVEGDYLRAVLLSAACCLNGSNTDDARWRRMETLILAHEARNRGRLQLPEWMADHAEMTRTPASLTKLAFLAVLRSSFDSSYGIQMIDPCRSAYLELFRDLPDVMQWLKTAWEASLVPGLWQQVILKVIDPAQNWRKAIASFTTLYDAHVQIPLKGAYARRQLCYMSRVDEMKQFRNALRNSPPHISRSLENDLAEYLARPVEAHVDEWISSTRRATAVSLTDYQRTEVQRSASTFLLAAADALESSKAWSQHTPAVQRHADVKRIREQLHQSREAAVRAARGTPWECLFQEIVLHACP
jgi:hypothetical protein